MPSPQNPCVDNSQRMTTPPTPILRLTNIRRSYNVGTDVETEVLHGISIALQQAAFVALRGPSGSGKSTLLNIIGLLERPTSGTLEIAGQTTAALDDAALTKLRGATIGFVFQFHHLLPAFTALENVLMPPIIAHGTATALSLRPRLILADEPTGNLDTVTADEVFGLLREFNQDHGSACLIVTHDQRLAQRCDRILELVDGRLVGD